MSSGSNPPDRDNALHAQDVASAQSAGGSDLEFGDCNSVELTPNQPVPPPLPLITCNRCGKEVPAALQRCPFCDARLSGTGAVSNWGEVPCLHTSDALRLPAASNVAVTRLLIFYVLMLSTNLVGHWIGQAMHVEHLSDKEIAERMLPVMIFVESLDAIIVFVALFKVPWPPPVGPSDPFYRRIGWLTGPLVLGVVLGLNFAYHTALESYLQFPEWARSKIGLPIGWAIVTVCIQPAIVEELFFRFIALGTLTRVMGIGGAICVSSVMFGMAHSSVLLSIPILTVVGAGLGFVRVMSGSILLPMLLHSLHNAVVLYLENAR